MAEAPTGTVTLLFTDIEGSTRLWEAHAVAMRAALARHDALLRHCIDDPDFALAWAGLSRVHQMQAGFGFAPIDEGYERGREAAQHALRLDPELAEGHIALGLIFESHDWNWAAADASLRRALELAPGDANAVNAAAGLERILGRRDKALELARKAIALDPLSARTHRQAAHVYALSDRLDEAASALRLALDLSPNSGLTHAFLALTAAAGARRAGPRRGRSRIA